VDANMLAVGMRAQIVAMEHQVGRAASITVLIDCDVMT